MSALDVVQKVKSYRAGIIAVRANPDLSSVGKQKQVDALRDAMDKYRPQAAADLKTEWDALRLKYKLIEKKKQVAQTQAAGQWDFSRLEYQSAALRARIATIKASGNTLAGRDPMAIIEQEYQAAMSSGDKHAARTWGELGPGLLAEFFPNDSHAPLARRMAGDLAKLTTTPELAELDKQGAELVQEALALGDATDAVKNAYIVPHPLNGRNEFDALREGVNVSQRYDSERGGFVTTMTVQDVSPHPGVTFTQKGAIIEVDKTTGAPLV